jgi:hypothetical protein
MLAPARRTLKLALTTSSSCCWGPWASGNLLLRRWSFLMSSSVDGVLVHAGRSRIRLTVATTAPGEPAGQQQQPQPKEARSAGLHQPRCRARWHDMMPHVLLRALLLKQGLLGNTSITLQLVLLLILV